MYQIKNKLPADPTAMVLGIIALVIGIAGCCCYGITAIVPLAMAIIGLVMANKSIREYKQNPEAYHYSSYSNVNTAKIINIIAVVFNSIVVLVFIVALAFYGTVISSAILDDLKRGDSDYDNYDYETYEWESDSTETDVEIYDIEKQKDSIQTDTLTN